ncbi:unnamed protein product, partial [Mesorhabditis spiculigera]
MAWPFGGKSMLSVLCMVTALMIVESCSPLLKNGTLPATIGGLVSPDGSTATAVLTLDTNTPYGLAVNDTAVALLPISAQLRQLQDPRIKGDPRIVQIDPLEQTIRSLQDQLVEACQENTKLKAECEEVLRLRDESTTTLLPKTGDDNSSLTVVAAPIGGTYIGGMFGVVVGVLLVFAFLLYCLCLRPIRFVIDAVHLNSLYNKYQLI